MRSTRGLMRVYAAGWALAAVVAAVAVHEWKGRLAALEERLADAERIRDEVLRRRAAEERVRIARDLHDSLTHSISVVTMQAGVAAHLARKRGEPVPEAISAIGEAAREASRELRETLDVLRRDDAGNGHAQHGIAGLPSLVERSEAAGLRPELVVVGPTTAVPSDVDAAVYRIVQESLTNVARHAGPVPARVRVECDGDAVTVRVDDDGAPPGRGVSPSRPGLGLVGMRERVTALGGHLAAGPAAGGGFRVLARLPLAPAPAVAR